MKAIIAIDSFKGCLTSAEAGKAALKAFADGEAEVIPVSDGGEGFSTILTESLGGSFRTVSCHDPLGRSIKARYGIIGRTAIIETAAASGLGLLRKDELNPLLATSYGTGELISDALEYDCEEIWLGLGGSATCDGGTGMLQALGYRFLPDDSGSFVSGDIQRAAPREESVSRNIPNVILKDIHGIDIPERNKLLDSCKITGFYDVSAPFCGTGGAARMLRAERSGSRNGRIVGCLAHNALRSLFKIFRKRCLEYSGSGGSRRNRRGAWRSARSVNGSRDSKGSGHFRFGQQAGVLRHCHHRRRSGGRTDPPWQSTCRGS